MMMEFFRTFKKFPSLDCFLGSLYTPRELKCVCYAYKNVTCYWTPAVNAYSDTNYTLQVNM